MKIFVVDPGKFSYPYDYSLCNALVDNGHEVRLIGSKFKYGMEIPLSRYKEVFFFYNIATLLSSQSFFSGLFERSVKGFEHVVCQFFLFFYILFCRPDVVHVQWVVLKTYDCFLYRCLIKLGINVVYTAHNLIPHDSKRFDNWLFVYRTFNKVVVHTDSSKAELLERLGGEEHCEISVIPHGDFSYIHSYASLKEDWFEEFKAKNANKQVILLFGIIKPYKGLDLLVEVASEFSDCVFLVLGKVGDKEYYNKVRSKIVDLELDGMFYFHTEFVKDEFLPELTNGCNAAIMPYRDICQSGVFYLMAELKLPILASNVGQFSSMLAENRGLVFSLGVQGDLQGKLRKYLSLNYDERRKMAENNLMHVRNECSWSKVSRLTLDFYGVNNVK